MELLDGKLASKAIKDLLTLKVAQLTTEGKKIPHLAAVLIGNNGASETYVGAKVKACAEIGYKSTLIRLEDGITENRLLSVIDELNNDPDVDGILVQLPLPRHISDEKVINSIHPSKDVDGFHPENVGRLVQGMPAYIPATPHGILLLLEHYKIDTKGKHAVVLGRSNIVGRPISILLSGNTTPGNNTVLRRGSKGSSRGITMSWPSSASFSFRGIIGIKSISSSGLKSKFVSFISIYSVTK